MALKTVGLCALLVQHGCWIPCDGGSRMDLFQSIFASIGDQQTVQEDLSSFSSHLLTLNTMMQHSGNASPQFCVRACIHNIFVCVHNMNSHVSVVRKTYVV